VHEIPLWASSDFAAPMPRGPREDIPTDPIFDIDVERLVDQPVVAHVFGAVDLLTARELRMCVDDNLDAERGLVVDLTCVGFLAAAGLTVLADAGERASRDNRAWAVVASSRPVLRPLEVLGLDQRLPTYDTVPNAVAAVRAAVVPG
jgi:anti-sigma B factor antagonist